MKFSVSMPEDLVERIDSYAKSNYMSRSGVVSLASHQFILQTEAFQAIKSVSVAINKIADSGEISEEDRKQLEDFERFCSLIMNE